MSTQKDESKDKIVGNYNIGSGKDPGERQNPRPVGCGEGGEGNRNPEKLYEIIENPKELYLIMEYANGGELFDYIVKNTKVKEKEACKFFQQILSGVEYIHKIGVVHRDLKPENLLLDQNLNIKIVDFGLSNTYHSGETLKTACGSPCYAAPEMIAGKRYQGLLVDLWSCGVIMYALICGYLPFEDPNTAKLYKKIIAGEYEIPKFVSPDARDLLQSILNTDPARRFKVDDIRSHKWYQQVQQNIEEVKGIVIGTDKIQLDDSIIDQLKGQFNIDPSQTRKMVLNNRHNNTTTLYYLIQQRHIRQGKSKGSFVKEGSKESKEQQQQEYQTSQQKAREQEKQMKEIEQLSKIMEEEQIMKLKREEKEKEKPRTHIPPVKLQFNVISQAVNNSISSVGTNTSNTPITTNRKNDYEYRPITDRGVVDRPIEEKKWNNYSMIDERVKIKSITQNSDIKSKSPTIVNSNKAKFLNMSYFIQNNKKDRSTSRDHNPTYQDSSLKATTRNPKSANANFAYSNTFYESVNQSFQKQMGMKLHKGPFNMKCVTYKPAQMILDELVKVLNSQKLRFKYKTRYEIVCEYNELTKFEIGAYLLQNTESLILIKGNFISGNFQNYNQISSQIIQSLKL